MSTDRGGLRKKSSVAPEEDGEGWLISYADMMTLMFGFFVILNSMSSPNPEKIEKLKESTSKKMGAKYKKPYEEIITQLVNILQKSIPVPNYQIKSTEAGVEIVFNGKDNFFRAGSSALGENSILILKNIGGALLIDAKNSGYQIFVEGHTDSTPISTRIFPSNWELSSARACTVIRLFQTLGFPVEDLRPVGLADTEPLVAKSPTHPKLTPEEDAQNRRIVIRVQRKLTKTAPVRTLTSTSK